MKKTILLFAMTFGLMVLAQAQNVTEKDVVGTWKLVIDVEEKMDQEAEEADSMLEEIIIKSVSGFVGGILDDIDIYFDFQRNGTLKLTVNAYDETEVEKGTWYINKRGYLVIEDIDSDGDNDFNINTNDDEWKLMDGILVNEDHEDDRAVYMARVN